MLLPVQQRQLSTAAAAAFVADIYGTAVKQGPSLPLANRSALMSEFRTNSTKFRNRVLAGLTQVSRQSLYTPAHVLQCTAHVMLDPALPIMPGEVSRLLQTSKAAPCVSTTCWPTISRVPCLGRQGCASGH